MSVIWCRHEYQSFRFCQRWATFSRSELSKAPKHNAQPASCSITLQCVSNVTTSVRRTNLMPQTPLGGDSVSMFSKTVHKEENEPKLEATVWIHSLNRHQQDFRRPKYSQLFSILDKRVFLRFCWIHNGKNDACWISVSGTGASCTRTVQHTAAGYYTSGQTTDTRNTYVYSLSTWPKHLGWIS